MDDNHFIIAGAQRSGSTYLYHLCAEHPRIEMAQPVQPEPKFFMTDSLFERGLGYYREHYFKGKPGAILRGEKSTSYIEVEKAAARIAECLPDAKIVFILRNPVERAVSNYWFSVKNGLEPLSIEEAFLQEETRSREYDAAKVSVSPHAYLRRGRYMDYIGMYEKYIPRERIHIVIYEQITLLERSLRGLYSFLGVDAEFLPGVFRTVINANQSRPPGRLDPQLEGYLRDYYREPNRRLFERLGTPIAEWER
jgi:hypothetical protein